MSTLHPTPEEITHNKLNVRNGIELELGRQDVLLNTAVKLMTKYPHHLVLVQSGSIFLGNVTNSVLVENSSQ